MSYFRDLYATFIRVSLSIEMQYRVANVIWLMGMIMEPVIYLSVWSVVARARRCCSRVTTWPTSRPCASAWS